MTKTTDPLHLPSLGTSLRRYEARFLTEHGTPIREWGIVGLGQSVMAGGGPAPALLETLPGEPDAPIDGVFMFNKSNQVVPAKVPTSEEAPGINTDPLLHVAKGLRPYFPPAQKLVCINRAVSNTTFHGGDWNPGDPKFEAAKASIEAFLARPGAAVLAYKWIQGESDGVQRDWAEAHPAAFAAMVEAFRSLLPADALGSQRNRPWVIGTIAQHAQYGAHYINAGYMGAVHRLPYTALVDFRDLSYSDDFHPTQPARREMGLRMAQAYFAALANDGRAAVSRMRPTPLFRLRATAATGVFGNVALESPLTGTAFVPTPTIAHVTSGTPGTGVFGTDGNPRGAVIGFLAGGIAINQLTMEPRGWSYGGWFNPAALTRDMPLFAPKTVSVSDSDPGHLLALQYVDQVTVAGEGSARSRYRIKAQGPVAGVFRTEQMYPSGQWVHVMIVNVPRPGFPNGDHYLFVNGRFVHAWTQPVLANLGLQVGILASQYATSFIGAADEVAYWNVPLSPSQVEEEYRATLSPRGGGGPFQLP